VLIRLSVFKRTSAPAADGLAATAYLSWDYSMKAIAEYIGMH
jgi:hypothetical protein